MANCMLPNRLMAQVIGEMNGHPSEGTVRIKAHDDHYAVTWVSAEGIQNAANFPATWALLSLDEFRYKFATTLMSNPVSATKKRPKPEDYKTIGEFADALIEFLVNQRLGMKND